MLRISEAPTDMKRDRWLFSWAIRRHTIVEDETWPHHLPQRIRPEPSSGEALLLGPKGMLIPIKLATLSHSRISRFRTLTSVRRWNP